jgi:hypothetical protein
MVVLVIAIKADNALAVGLVPQSSVMTPATKLNANISLMTSSITQTGRFRSTAHKCCILATNFSHKCYLALVAFVFLGYNIIIEQEETMTLDTLIFKLDVIRAQAGTGNLQVLYRDPCDGVLYSEITVPQLAEVFSGEAELFDALDLDTGDYYVEI